MQKQKSKQQSPSPSAGDTLTKTLDESAMMFINLAQESIVMFGIGVCHLGKLILRHPVFSSVSLYATYVFTRIAIKDSWHFELFHKSAPDLFTVERLDWFLQFTLNQHHFTFLSLILFIVCVALGFRLRMVRSKFIEIFTTAGLTNGKGDTPKLVGRNKLDKYRVQYDFDANGVGLSEFKDKQERIEAQFGMEIESIKMGKRPGRTLVTFNKRKFPELIQYSELSEGKVLPPHSFYVGLSPEGVVTQDIAELPHMLIAGATGTGKSVYFKSVLYSLLDSTKYRHLQLYIIDLKRGLEAADFKGAPNVKIVKKMKDAVTLLTQVKEEMDRRFDILEEKDDGSKVINPKTDGVPRIVVAVDEASVLYMNRNRYDDDYKDAMQARQLADSISKLSRAAAIHLILATQKVDRNVLPTSVTENMTGRMAFRANSFHGSNALLQSKDASDLPDIPGRGVWRVGSKKMIVQAPYIDDKQIKSLCKRTKNEFDESDQSDEVGLIGDEEIKETHEAKQDFDVNAEGGEDETKEKD